MKNTLYLLLILIIASCGNNAPNCKKIANNALRTARHINVLSDTNEINKALVELEMAGSCKSMDKANKEYLEEAWNDLQRQKKEKITKVAWNYTLDTLEGVIREFFLETRHNDSVLVISHNRDREYNGGVDMRMNLYISKGQPLHMSCRFQTPDNINWLKLYIDTHVIAYDNIVFMADLDYYANPPAFSYGAFSATVSENSKFYLITDTSKVKIEYGDDKTKKTVDIPQREVLRLSHLIKLYTSLRMGKIPMHL